MDLIKKEIAKIQVKNKVKDKEHQSRPVGPLRRSPTMKDNIVLFEDNMNPILDKLTGDESNLQILPITGMGGIGKTTLAQHVYVSPLIIQSFDIRGWITLSQEYHLREILLRLLQELGSHFNQDELQGLEYHELGEKLHKYLSGRRYLTMMDDMWSITSWDELGRYLPDNSNKSRIIVTTRISNVAYYFGSSNTYKMYLLDENRSWNLFCTKVFANENCPELEEIAKQIVENCKGLPLSISVVGGLLANSKMTHEYWEYVACHTSAVVNLEDDARCLKILSTSYNSLPVYLKPCFLHLGVFPNGREIQASKLIKLWVAEGFQGPPKIESLEEFAQSCLRGLIDRNLIFVSKWGSTGDVKYCKIHDLLRDFCLREAQEKKFLCVNMEQNLLVSQDLRRIVLHRQILDDQYLSLASHALQSASLARSLTYNKFHLEKRNRDINQVGSCPRHNFRLLRILDVVDNYPLDDVFRLVNLRYISSSVSSYNFGMIPSSICRLWNLQTLVIETHGSNMTAPPEIWKMTQLRHLIIPITLPDPPCRGNVCVLANLQTLSKVFNLRLTADIIRRIPNIKKLKMKYWDTPSSSSTCLSTIVGLDKLQSLVLRKLQSDSDPLIKTLQFKSIELPLSLKKLTLSYSTIYWKDITTKVGSLPNLEKLRLVRCPEGEEWNPIEGQFLRLKFLEVRDVFDLKYWGADETHFPRLEHLVLVEPRRLVEIPSGIGDIQSLQSIQFDLVYQFNCRFS